MRRVLVLGGTRFVGRAIVEACLAGGSEVTIFNRGQTNPELFPEVERILGDRTGALTELIGRRWDVVFDVAAYDPKVVETATRMLEPGVERYVFVSTLSVYADQSQPHAEEWPLLKLRENTSQADLYGARKARAEEMVRERFGQRALIARAGMIAGPWDPTDRLTYWPRRLSQSGTALAPGSPSDPVQFIDVRDLAGWMVNASGKGVSGTFNATGEVTPLADVLEACRRVVKSDARLEWVSTERLLAAGVDPWMGVPLWIAAPGWEGANRVDISAAVSAGLTLRPIEETVAAGWAWDRERRAAAEAPEMFTLEEERRLLQAVSV